MKEHLKVFIVITLFIQAFCLGIYFFAKRDNEVGLLIEIYELIPIYHLLIKGLFKRCPICGKRKLTTWSRCGGSRYTLYDADCRNCKSKIGIEHDRDLHKWTYFHKKGSLDTTIINPIWETKENNHYK